MISLRAVWIGIAVIFAIECVVLLWVLADRHDLSFGAPGLQDTAQAQSTTPSGGVTQAQDPSPAQDAAPTQGTGTCPNAQLVDTFQGNGDQQTDTFTTTTNSLRVSYEVTGSDPELPSLLFIDVIDADDPNQFPVADATQEGDGAGETFANVPPGTYFLDISFFGGEYTVTVEQCDGAGGGGGGGGSGGGGGGTTRPGNGELLEGGGPLEPPYPTMMDGSCPPEFPLKRGNGCYPS